MMIMDDNQLRATTLSSLLESGFNLDPATGEIFCSEDYNKKTAATCYSCRSVRPDFNLKRNLSSGLSRKPIVPKQGEKTVERLTALDKSFHTDCFRCEVGVI